MHANFFFTPATLLLLLFGLVEEFPDEEADETELDLRLAVDIFEPLNIGLLSDLVAIGIRSLVLGGVDFGGARPR